MPYKHKGRCFYGSADDIVGYSSYMENMENMEIINFPYRKDRSEYVSRKYENYLKGSVLDVGCHNRYLSSMIASNDYTGIDVSGSPDLYIDLDSIDNLPFGDNEFDSVVCSDVLEHLDEFHLVFSELIRVAKKDIIISLPNCWNSVRRHVERGYGSVVHYGLPLNKPDDRHKWFFNYVDIINFFTEQSLQQGLEIKSVTVNIRKRHFIIDAVRKVLFFDKKKYYNRYSHTIWVHYEKK